jgi:hypothetical protein
MEGRLGCANCHGNYPIRRGIADLRRADGTAGTDGSGVPNGSAGSSESGESVGSGESARVGGEGSLDPAHPAPASEEDAYRTAALLGVTAPRSTVLILGGASDLAERVAALLPGIHVVGVGRAFDSESYGGSGTLSLLLAGDRLPFRNGVLHGVAVRGEAVQGLVEEAARALRSGARLVLDPAPSEASEVLRQKGFDTLLEQDSVMVAVAPGPR